MLKKKLLNMQKKSFKYTCKLEQIIIKIIILTNMRFPPIFKKQ